MSACPFPYTVRQYRDVVVTLKNGLRKPVKQFIGTVSVPCGKCVACRRRKQNEWAFRCMAESRHSKSSYFVGLSYNDENLPISDLGQPTLIKEHLQKHIKSLRDDLGELKFFGCGEYGDTFGRPHYHYLLFLKEDVHESKVRASIEKRWNKGFVDVDLGVTPANAKYCCKYALKQVGFDYGDCVPPFALMSRRPGIGKGFLDEINVQDFRERKQFVVHDVQGTPYSIPRLYKEYIYTHNECLDHTLLLNKIMNVKNESRLQDYESASGLNFYKFDQDLILQREKNFVKQLKRECYEFKFTPHYKQSRPRREVNRGDDLKTDEF